MAWIEDDIKKTMTLDIPEDSKEEINTLNITVLKALEKVYSCNNKEEENDILVDLIGQVQKRFKQITGS